MTDSCVRGLADAVADLLTGSRCVGCAAPGRALCPRCTDRLGGCRPRVCVPDPVPAALLRPRPLPVVTAGTYEGLLRDLIVAHKEERRLALAGPLGRLLACAVEGAAGGDGNDLPDATGAAGRDPGSGVVLVPVPSSPLSVRKRGHDPLLRVTRVAAARLRRRGIACTVARLLSHARPVLDQAGLSARARTANLDGAFVAATRGRTRLSVVVVDDVVTTGASLAEAVRALRAGGFAPVAAATVAATARHSPRRLVALPAAEH